MTRLLPVIAIAANAVFSAESDELLRHAVSAANKNSYRQAIVLADKAEKWGPLPARLHRVRGRWHFRLGHLGQSLLDFDRCIELAPAIDRELWERGITCYYLGKYEEGAKQFELYQTYHDNDVENSVWRFLCQAHVDGVQKSREAMLPIRDDRRVPMMRIYDMFRGTTSPEDVLTAVRAGKPTTEELKKRLFYADLYIGLYYDSLGKFDLAQKHIASAASAYETGGYMWAVAVVHQQRLQSPQP